MPEETIWKGTSSHWRNFKPYACALLALPLAVALHFLAPATSPWVFILPVPFEIWAVWRYLLLRTTEYQLTTERLITQRGILTRVTDTLELYRVRDQQVVQPLLQRIVGLQNIHIITSDASTAEIILDHMPVRHGLGDHLRKNVEACREAKRVRAMDVINEDPGTHTHAG